MKSRIIIMAVAGMLMYSCSPKIAPTPPPPPPAPEPVAVAEPAKPNTAEGLYIYERNCAKCHRLYKPEEYSAQEWRPILTKMQKMADISDEDTEKVYAYLIAEK